MNFNPKKIIEDLTNNLLPIEKKINYVFKNKKLLLNSFVHSSYANEKKMLGLKSNERLEFLGDAVLELVISKYLMEDLPDCDEGVLTLKRSVLVQEHSLAKLAKKLKLHHFIILGCGEKKESNVYRDALLCDMLEALIGAVYQDSGFIDAEKVVLKIFTPLIEDLETIENQFNYKNKLQELTLKNLKSIPKYKLVGQTGPEHKKKYKVHVFIDNKYITSGTGTSIKKAEHKASQNALNLIERREIFIKKTLKKL